MACAPSEDPDQSGHPPSLTRVFAVRMKKAWVLSCPLSAQRRLWSDWADTQADLSLRWANTFCWFCHAVAQRHEAVFCWTERSVSKIQSSKYIKLWKSWNIDFGIYTTLYIRKTGNEAVCCDLKEYYDSFSTGQDNCCFHIWLVTLSFSYRVLVSMI